MVYNGLKIGEIDNTTLIYLGYGNTKVSVTSCEDESGGKYSCIMFTNLDEPIPVGTDIEDNNSDHVRPQAIITFFNLESIDVIMMALKKAKSILSQEIEKELKSSKNGEKTNISCM